MTLVPKSAAEAARLERAVDTTRAELHDATTVAEVNRARLAAEGLKQVLAKAVQGGASDLAETHREAQKLSLEAALSLGERALEPAIDGGSKFVGTKHVKLVAVAAGIASSTMRDIAKLSLARRVREADFDRLVVQALDKGKQPPLTKLRALIKGPPKERDDAPPAEEQVKIRLTPGQAVKVDALRGDVDRTKWVFALVEDVALVDPLDSARLLLERVEHALERAPGARGKRDRAAAHVARALAELRGGS